MENINVQDSRGQIFCRLSFSPAEDLLRVQWVGEVSDTGSVKQACNEVVRLVSQTQCSKLLSDNQHQHGPWPPIQDWLTSLWRSNLRYMGLHSFAYLHAAPAVAFDAPSSSALVGEEEVAVRHFSNSYEAEEWLSVENKKGV